ncbi:Hypothetical predicted protein [Olea europaea subsp. europaea]|uniref:Uncharacterized protein n=1 Tax=Olea europaea subsp. europaea TaxID=158383 RepID=A0A8S0Q0L8_OLEEU|nr:Hypothetical predicted protein [Olea europaea subsp. europaea]
MEFEFLIPEDARLQAHISQRSNLKYVKIVMERFDEHQREDFRNSCLRFLAEVPNIQFSSQLIQQLVFRTIRTDKMNEPWFNVQGHTMRSSLQEYVVLRGLRCGVFSEGDQFARVLERYGRMMRFRKLENDTSLYVRDIFRNVQLHVYTTLRPTVAEREQAYVSTLVPYDDYPCLRWMTLLGLLSQHSLMHRVPVVEVVDSRLCRILMTESPVEEAVRTRCLDVMTEKVRGSSIHTRPVGTSGASLTRGKVDELLLDQRIFIEMRHRIVKLEIVQHVTSEFTTLLDCHGCRDRGLSFRRIWRTHLAMSG